MGKLHGLENIRKDFVNLQQHLAQNLQLDVRMKTLY